MNSLVHIVKTMLDKRESLLVAARRHTTPFYLYDRRALLENIATFGKTFSLYIPRFRGYYAMKINPFHRLVKDVIGTGFGIDAGSSWEVSQALRWGCNDIVYYSPGKTEEDLLYAVEKTARVRLHIDSIGELHRLGAITNKRKRKIRAGVRIHTHSLKKWHKFGIHIHSLHSFWQEAQRYPFISLEGIHFHTSRNKDESSYTSILSALSTSIRSHFSPSEQRVLKYIDFGGGFEPFMSEGYYSSNNTAFVVREGLPLVSYAQKIGNTITKEFSFLPHLFFASEPGRIICNDAMHILLRVTDIKEGNIAIVDGGINMVGWERFLREYFPVINLTHPSLTEKRFTIFGKLCSSRDVWGKSCFASTLEVGDVLCIPYQGALTYSLAQNWILPIPSVYML